MTNIAEPTDFAPCPLCKQYSHSIGEDQLADAFNHFQMMYSHRGDGIPTQDCFDEKTRDAAQVLMAAARSSAPQEPDDAEWLREQARLVHESSEDEAASERVAARFERIANRLQAKAPETGEE